MLEKISFKVSYASLQSLCISHPCLGVIASDLAAFDTHDVQRVESTAVEILHQGGVFIH